MPKITIEAAQAFMERSLVKVGVPAGNASQIAEVVLDSELRGHPDHGLVFFRSIVNWHTKGIAGDVMNPSPDIRVTSDSVLATTIDGDNGCGVIAMNEAVERSVLKAHNHGMSAASVTNSGNVVALAPFVQKAADAGSIAFACSGFRFPVMPPVGGLSGTFGTNPMAYAAPAGKNFPFLLDMSTSGIAGAKVFESARNEEPIPEGFVEYADGSPLTDASDFQMGSSLILPMSGAKGYGLTMMVDLFANVLGDSDWGHFLWVLDPGQFQPIEKFKDLMDEEINRIKSGKKKTSVDEIFYAGERGQRRMARLRAEGIVPLDDGALNAMNSVSEELGVEVPTPISGGKG